MEQHLLVSGIARAMISTYGAEASADVDARTQLCLDCGDTATADFWARVGRAIRALDDGPPADR